MLRVRTWVAAMVAITLIVASASAAGLVWPGSEISQHAQAWFAMLKGDDAGGAQVLRRAHRAGRAGAGRHG